MAHPSNITPEQKRSLIRTGSILALAAILWPVIHLIASEQLELQPGSFLNALLISIKLPVGAILIWGLFFNITRAIRFAEGQSPESDEAVLQDH